MKKELQVSAIKNGTVIDHIPPHLLFKVIKLLELEKIKTAITIGNNYTSNKLGVKAIIKIEEKYFEDNEINKIALIIPNVKLSIIKNYEVVDKKVIEVPDKVVGLVECMNPKCITNHEDIVTRFKVTDKKEIDLKCLYCEKITDYNNIEIRK
ncbi:aspartate carbamoyltransferase regulatory subunit [Balneicella halophila]|uniref:Aspartate carbamoyltransferase regulatory chain n=1 Tax=Balneicella halophila TaxID=1537566 RepID=A0A7L4UPV7_BALHA|nr:aspartate carbamoyltransferase regulatory subunit [Balneicella halophila]PVX51074.1 aspartate carbamoyltransferase regulatory subunit [Balneicella halophila]